MEFRHLKYFQTAAEFLHFSRAADALGIAQSALSQQIKQLEADLECQLFDRSNKWKLQLTDAGKVFRTETKKIIDAVEAAKRNTRQASKGDLGALSINIIPSFFSSDKLFDSLKRMRKNYPDVFLKLSKHSSANILKKIENESLDFGIVRTINPDNLETNYIEFGREKILLALPENHRLASRKRIQISDLKNEKFIMMPYEESPFFYRIIELAFKKSGNFTPNIAEEIYNFDAILKLLPDSNLISFVPEMLKNLSFYKGIVLKPIADLNIDVKYVGIWRKNNNSQSLKNFLAILKEEFEI